MWIFSELHYMLSIRRTSELKMKAIHVSQKKLWKTKEMFLSQLKEIETNLISFYVKYIFSPTEIFLIFLNFFSTFTVIHEIDDRKIILNIVNEEVWFLFAIPSILSKRATIPHLKLLNIKRPRYMALEIQFLSWDRHNRLSALNRFTD